MTAELSIEKGVRKLTQDGKKGGTVGTARGTSPKGVIAIWTSPDGDVVATNADFDRSSYGGFKLWEAQRMRARRAVQRDAVDRYAGPAIAACLSNYLFEQIAEAMRGKGHKITCRSVGYDDEIREAIER